MKKIKLIELRDDKVINKHNAYLLVEQKSLTESDDVALCFIDSKAPSVKKYGALLMAQRIKKRWVFDHSEFNRSYLNFSDCNEVLDALIPQLIALKLILS